MINLIQEFFIAAINLKFFYFSEWPYNEWCVYGINIFWHWLTFLLVWLLLYKLCHKKSQFSLTLQSKKNIYKHSKIDKNNWQQPNRIRLLLKKKTKSPCFFWDWKGFSKLQKCKKTNSNKGMLVVHSTWKWCKGKF